MSDDFGFDEVPMPYDITIMAKGAGTKEVEYNVIPSPKIEPLTSGEEAELKTKPSIEEVIEKLRAKQGSEPTIQQEQPVNNQNQSGYDKFKTAGQSSGNHRPIQRQTELQEDEINVEDIPF